MATETEDTMRTGILFTLLYQFLERLTLRGYSKNTIASYKATLEILVKSFPDELPPNPNDLTSWVYTAWSGRSPGSILQKMSAIQSFIKFMQKNGIIYIWNTDDDKPKKSKRNPVFLPHGDLMGFIEEIRNSRDKTIMRFLYATGLRVSESAGLNIEQIDFSNNQISVIGKGDKERSVFFDDETKTMIIKYLDGRTSGPLFLNDRGGRLTVRSVQRLCNRYFPEGFSPHKIRHSYATNLYEESKNLLLVKDTLGHSSLAVTNIYLHTSTEARRNGYAKYHPLNKKLSEE